jgi:hypothetical protein
MVTVPFVPLATLALFAITPAVTVKHWVLMHQFPEARGVPEILWTFVPTIEVCDKASAGKSKRAQSNAIIARSAECFCI